MYPVSALRRRRIWLFTVLALILMIAGYLKGFYAPPLLAAQMADQVKQLAQSMNDTHSVITIVWTIFIHNVWVAVLMIITGSLVGVMPAYLIWTNGLMIGYVVGLLTQHIHVSAVKVLLYAILPHGVIELSAFLWAGAIGLHLGLSACQSLTTGIRRMVSDRQPPGHVLAWKTEFVVALKRIPILVAMLFVAACIEGWLTPMLINRFL